MWSSKVEKKTGILGTRECPVVMRVNAGAYLLESLCAPCRDGQVTQNLDESQRMALGELPKKEKCIGTSE